MVRVPDVNSCTHQSNGQVAHSFSLPSATGCAVELYDRLQLHAVEFGRHELFAEQISLRIEDLEIAVTNDSFLRMSN